MMSPLGSNRKIKQFVSAVSIAQLVQIVKPHQVEEQPLIAIVVGGACNKDKGIYGSLCSSAVLSAEHTTHQFTAETKGVVKEQGSKVDANSCKNGLFEQWGV